MKKMLYIILGLLVTLCNFAADPRFDTMIIFGDSLSDSGNLYRFFWDKFPVSPPYYDGRFSNGPLWIEQLYQFYYPPTYTEGYQNYAVGGAGAVLSYKQNLPYTLAFELNNYLYWNTYGKKETSLYTIWIGANNYVNGPTNIEMITSNVVEAIGDAIERIIAQGGDKFFVPNLPDLGRMPQSVDMRIQPLVTKLAIIHNQKLAAKLNELQKKYPKAILVSFDIFTFFNDALDHAIDFGFSNTNAPCYMGSYSGWLLKSKPDEHALINFLKEQDSQLNDSHWEIIKASPMLKEAAMTSYLYHLMPDKHKFEPDNCAQHVFWDHVHPTTQAHYYIAQKAREALDSAGLKPFIPE